MKLSDRYPVKTVSDLYRNAAGDPAGHESHGGHGGHGGGHHWMMMVCCIPMIVIAVALVATGVVGVGFIFVALMCTAMMWFMMRAMGDMGRGGQ